MDNPLGQLHNLMDVDWRPVDRQGAVDQCFFEGMILLV
jgi:hypothetical protein